MGVRIVTPEREAQIRALLRGAKRHAYETWEGVALDLLNEVDRLRSTAQQNPAQETAG